MLFNITVGLELRIMRLRKLCSMSASAIWVMLSCSATIGCRESKATRPSVSDTVSQEKTERMSSDSNAYRKMFGSITVPTYHGFGEPEALEPLVFVVTGLDGEIVAVRRPNRDLGRWGFDEIDLQSINAAPAGGASPTLVIAADKSLGISRFLHVLETVRERTSRSKVWIQVWGVHPYPLQIHLDISDFSVLRTSLKTCQNLQEVIDYLSPRSISTSQTH